MACRRVVRGWANKKGFANNCSNSRDFFIGYSPISYFQKIFSKSVLENQSKIQESSHMNEAS